MPVGPQSMHQAAAAARRMQHPLSKTDRSQQHTHIRQITRERIAEGSTGATLMEEHNHAADAGMAIPYSASNVDAELKSLPAHLINAVEAAKTSRINSLDLDSEDSDADIDLEAKRPLLRPLSLNDQRSAAAATADSRITAHPMPPGRRMGSASSNMPQAALASKAADAAFESFLGQACAPPVPVIKSLFGKPSSGHRETAKQQACFAASALYGQPAGPTTTGHAANGLTVRGHAATGIVLSSQMTSHLSGPWAHFPLTVDSSSVQGRNGAQLPQTAWGPSTVGGALTGAGLLLPASAGSLASGQAVASDSIRMLRGPRCGFVANGKGDDVNRQKLAYKASMILAGTYAGELFKDTGKAPGRGKRGRPRAEE